MSWRSDVRSAIKKADEVGLRAAGLSFGPAMYRTTWLEADSLNLPAGEYLAAWRVAVYLHGNHVADMLGLVVQPGPAIASPRIVGPWPSRRSAAQEVRGTLWHEAKLASLAYENGVFRGILHGMSKEVFLSEMKAR